MKLDKLKKKKKKKKNAYSVLTKKCIHNIFNLAVNKKLFLYFDLDTYLNQNYSTKFLVIKMLE